MSEPAEKLPRFESLEQLVRWCQLAPEETRLNVRRVGKLIQYLKEFESVPLDGRTDGSGDREGEEMVPKSWHERIWTAHSDIRLDVEQVAEAVNRPKSYIYKQVSEGNIPHRKDGGVLVFRVGEIRQWIEDREVIQRSGPTAPPRPKRRLQLMED